jgi:hypothetical protein
MLTFVSVLIRFVVVLLVVGVFLEYEGSIINSKLIPSYELVKQLALLFQLCWLDK